MSWVGWSIIPPLSDGQLTLRKSALSPGDLVANLGTAQVCPSRCGQEMLMPAVGIENCLPCDVNPIFSTLLQLYTHQMHRRCVPADAVKRLPAVGIENCLRQVWHPVKWCKSYSDLYIFDNLIMAAFVGYFYLCLSAYPKAGSVNFVIHKINPEYRPTDCWKKVYVFVTFLRLDLQATMLT